MSHDLTSIFALYRLPTGRRIFALEAVAKAAEEAGVAAVAELAAAGARADRETLGLEQAWRGQQRVDGHDPGAVAADLAIDSAVVALANVLQGVRDGMAPGGDEQQAADRIHRRWFPDGVAPVVQRTFVEQHTLIARLLQELGAGGDLAADVATIGIEGMVDHLASLNAAIAPLLDPANQPAQLAFHDVVEARAAGQRRLAEVVATIVGRFPLADEPDASTRAALLAPILRQNAAIAAYRTGRRGGRALPDVNPDAPTTAHDVEPPQADDTDLAPETSPTLG